LGFGIFPGAGSAALHADTIVFPAGDYTGDIYLAARTDTFVVDGDTTISGRITGTATILSTGPSQITYGGAFIKTGDGTLTLTGGRNWFGGSGITTNTIASGTLVVTAVGALGQGNIAVAPAATLVFRGLRDGALFPQAITGTGAGIAGGRVEVTDSDMTLNHRHGYVIGALPAAESDFARLAITRSRLHMLASGTLSTGLGGAGAAVSVADRSTLVLGREGVVPGVSGLVAPVNYAINARDLDVDATSALVLNPGASLVVTGTLALAPGSSLTFGGAGVARLEYAALAPGSASPDALAAAPAGCTLDTTPLIGSGGRQRRDYLVVNQGANPMHDTAMTTGAIDAILDTVSGRLNELFLLPAAEKEDRARQKRKWANTAWLRYIAGTVDYETASPSQPGHNGRLGGLILGLDSAWRSRVNLGLHAGITESSLDTSNATSLLSKQRHFGVSATPRFKHFYLSADLFSGGADSESFRREPGGSTTARWDNTFHGGGIEAGTVLRPWKNGFLRPRLGLRYTRVGVSGYTERAPVGASPVRVENFTDSLARLNLAIEGAHRLRLLRRDALAGVSLGCRRHVREPRQTLDAAYRDYPERGFTLERGDYYADAATLGASLHLAVTQRTRAGLSLNYERGSSHERLTANLVLSCNW
jgi:hypothetical protein